MASQLRTAAFYGTGALGLGTGAYIFHTLTDFSQAITQRENRNDFMQSYNNRHRNAAIGMSGIVANTLVYWTSPKGKRPAPVLVWAGMNGAALALWYGGYLNPEIMLRPRNHNTMYLSTCDAAKIVKDGDTGVVTQLEDQEPRYYPDKQILRPHMALVGVKKDKTPATICYCGLTGTGVVYEAPPLPDGTPHEFVPITQMKNNLIILDKATGHFGHQINGLNETRLLEALGEDNYDKVGTRLPVKELEKLGIEPGKEVPSWRMPFGAFASAFPQGQVFINDYREFPEVTKGYRPVWRFYDWIIDTVFDNAIGRHNTTNFQMFPTIKDVDERLPPKQRVFGFNVGDEFACFTEEFAEKAKNGVVNFKLDGVPLVASYDSKNESLGIFKRKDDKPIYDNVNVYGETIIGKNKDTVKLDRLETVKAGLFWFVWQEFFPQTKVNPTE